MQDLTAPSQLFTSNLVHPSIHAHNYWTEDVATPNPYQAYPSAPPTTPSISGSDSVNRAPTPLILDGSEFGSPDASSRQLHSSDFFGSSFDQYFGLPMSYPPEPMCSASVESKLDLGYLQTSSNGQMYGTGGFTSCPSVHITDPQNTSYPPEYHWNDFMTPQYQAFTMLPSRPSSAASSQYGTSF